MINTSISFSQDWRSGIEYKFDLKKIETADSITWFGWDYSHLIFNDPNIIASEIKAKSIPYWFVELEKSGFGKEGVEHLFKHKVFTNDPRTIQSLVVNIPDSKFIEIYRVPLDIDSVKKIVANYNVSGNGLGVVSIVSEIRKADIAVIIFTVIFDIKTKEILYVIKANGKAGDKGSVHRFYRKGLVLAMKVFFKSYKDL